LRAPATTARLYDRRIDANARWDIDTARARLPVLDRAAGGLDYVEQPGASLADLAVVRRRSGLRTAALLADDVVPAASSPAAGHVVVVTRPPDPDPGLLDRCRQRDPDRRRWWAGRLRRTADVRRARGRGA
jgi:hypothetical protein